MSYYGLRVYDANGAISFDSNTIACLLIDSFSVGATSSGSKVYNWIGTHSLFATSVVQLGSNGGHKVTVSGNTVTWTVITGPSLNTYRNVASNIYVFMV